MSHEDHTCCYFGCLIGLGNSDGDNIMNKQQADRYSCFLIYNVNKLSECLCVCFFGELKYTLTLRDKLIAYRDLSC